MKWRSIFYSLCAFPEEDKVQTYVLLVFTIEICTSFFSDLHRLFSRELSIVTWGKRRSKGKKWQKHLLPIFVLEVLKSSQQISFHSIFSLLMSAYFLVASPWAWANFITAASLPMLVMWLSKEIKMQMTSA